MEKNKKFRGTHNEFPIEDDMTLIGTVSTTDCTGMIPSGSIDNANEFRASNDLHHYSKANGNKK